MLSIEFPHPKNNKGDKRMSILQSISMANLVFAFTFIFSSMMIHLNIGYSFWSTNAVIIIAVILWLVTFLGLLWLRLKTHNQEMHPTEKSV